MTDVDVDIVVAGGGLAGLSAALVLGTAGWRVLLADPAPMPVANDLRTTAVLAPGVDLLREAGVWDALAPLAAPLASMRIVDAAGGRVVERDFRSADVGAEAFGWNLRNGDFLTGLRSAVERCALIERRAVSVTGMLARDTQARVRLTDGSVTARLVVACDGRGSTLRAGAGIGVRTLRHGQEAVVFAVTHERPHEGVSTEVHRDGGPFTLVPLADHGGRPASAVVWMVDGREAARLLALEPGAFSAEATERSAGLFGALELVGQRQSWPLRTQVATRMVADRLALAAEAAHAIPPIGAQGLNMSLADIRSLRDLCRQFEPGAPEMLRRYERARHPEVIARVSGVAMLNAASRTDVAALQGLRAAGVRALHDVTPVRRMLMRLGLGA